jgi:hypothetical protein
MPDDWPHPTRHERRGEFPEHLPHPGAGVLTRQQALDLARKHLADWIRDHPAVQRGDQL